MPALSPNQIKYVVDTFWSIYDSSHQVAIDYGQISGPGVRVYDSETSIFSEQTSLSESDFRDFNRLDKKIPFPFVADTNELIEMTNEGVRVNFDVIAAAFYFLSGWQEFVSDVRDMYDRYPFAESIQEKLKIVDIPVVNYYFDVLAEAVGLATGKKPKQIMFADAHLTVTLSHDIDLCRSGWKGESKAGLKKGDLLEPVRNLIGKAFGTDPWFNFQEIIQKEAEFGVKSTFFFLCRQGWIGNMPHSDFDVTSKPIRDVMGHIQQAGSEVAVHGSSGTHTDLNLFNEDLNLLGVDSIGNRFHFLNFNPKKTPGLLQKAGMKYDSTLGFAEHLGFRNGICHPFLLFDLNKDEATDVLEIPLVVMDAMFADDRYMNIEPEIAQEKIRATAKEIQKFGGCLSLLWHNTYYSKYKYRGWGEVYWDTVRELNNLGASFKTSAELAEIGKSRLTQE